MRLIPRLHPKRGFTPLHPESPAFQSGDEGQIKIKSSRKPRPLGRGVTGFTLIELIMTIVVVGIVAIPLALSINQQIESVFASQDFAVARNLARLEMERTNNMVYANIISANFTNYEGYNYDLNRAVTYARGSGASRESLKKITVSVMKSGSAQVLVNLITYLAKNISYGL